MKDNAGKTKRPKTKKRKARANRKLKDRVFRQIFSDPKVIIPFSNAIFDTNYPLDTKVEITTIDNTLIQAGINDLSYILDDRLIVLIEHQSTIDENMPYRMLQYIAEIYKKLEEEHKLYRQDKRRPLKRPKFVVLYNGPKNMKEDMRILRLSDMFAPYTPEDKTADDGTIDLELTVKMYNINKGRNKKMVKRCKTLYDYSIFINRIRENQKTMSLEEAIRKAVLDCIAQNILKEYLEKHKKEVVNMIIAEWDMDIALKVREEEGEERGMAKERRKVAAAMKAEGMDADTIARITGLTVDDILRL